ncbi:MAG TPA: LysE family transporter [Syntrophomonadaceae bacterium]|nr:LysE family transporter [Syntrophomonadaceae bacterium]
MQLDLIYKGMIVGFGVAAPVGPMALLCIQRGLNYGFRAGLVTGLGAAAADATYAGLAGWGLASLSTLIMHRHSWLEIITGLFFLFMGLRTFSAPLRQNSSDAVSTKTWSLFITSYFLTLSNPMTFLAFAAVFAGLGLSTANHRMDALILMNGVALGAICWWLLLCTLVNFFHSRLEYKHIRIINDITGCIILIVGLYLITQAV